MEHRSTDAPVESTRRRSFLGLAGLATGLGVAATAGMSSPAAAAENGPVYDVTDFGARGDGETDSSGAFIAAFDAVRESGGGCVIVPPAPKPYWISPKTGSPPPLILPSNLTLIGYGATLTRARGISFAVTSPGRPWYGGGATNITIRGLTMRGSYAEARPISLFNLHHASDVVISDCSFIECQGSRHCIPLAGCERVLIERCTFAGFHDDEGPKSAGRECIQLDYSYFGATGTTEPTGSYSGLLTRDVTIDHCAFLPLTVGGVTYPSPKPVGCHGYKQDSWMERIRFTNNLVVDPGHQPAVDDTPHASADIGILHLPTCADVLIADNRFIQTTPGMGRVLTFVAPNVVIPKTWDPNVRPPVKITLDSGIGAKRIRILGNTFTGFRRTSNDVPGQQVIWLRGLPGGGEITDVVIADNTFDDLTEPGDDTYVISANYADGLEIRGNTFGAAPAGIHVATCRRVRVTDNTFSAIDELCVDLERVTVGSVSGNTSQSGSPAGLVRVDDRSAGVSVTANVGTDISPSRGGAAVYVGGDGFTVTGNVLSGRGDAGIRVSATATGAVTGNAVNGFDDDVVAPRGRKQVVVTGNA
ncbi:NosD domain-containing protein [Jiangella asiatica]|nr:NosD domain-containing protein [Jiangella asiatica]